MTKLLRFAAATLALSLIAAPAFAGGLKTSPAGSWQSTDGSARVRVSLCGDGTQFCAKLTGLSGAARTPRNLELLNTYVVEGAQLADTNAWEGTVHFNGQTARGHITMLAANLIEVSGCELGMCKTLQFRRVGARAPETVASIPATQMPPRTVGLTLPE